MQCDIPIWGVSWVGWVLLQGWKTAYVVGLVWMRGAFGNTILVSGDIFQDTGRIRLRVCL